MKVNFFSLAVDSRRYIYMSGGKTKISPYNFIGYSNRVQKFDTLTGSLEEMPALIQARGGHSSIALVKHLYAFGGRLPSIEILNLVTKLAW